MIEFQNMPPAIAALPRDERGYPIPWFVSDVDGVRDFRIMCGRKLRRAVMERRCWVCGEPLDPLSCTFVIGPMCAVNLVSGEPPSHAGCAMFSAINCPFLSNPKAVRRDAGLPENATCAGTMIARNPGVTLLWHTQRYDLFGDGKGGTLFRIGPAFKTEWMTQGRPATKAEVMASIESGLPILQDMANRQGADAVTALDCAIHKAMKLVPKR